MNRLEEAIDAVWKLAAKTRVLNLELEGQTSMGEAEHYRWCLAMSGRGLHTKPKLAGPMSEEDLAQEDLLDCCALPRPNRPYSF